MELSDQSPAAVEQWFLRLLGRPSTVEEAARFGSLDFPALVAAITDLPEYRNRFRDAEPTNPNALAAAHMWPLDRRDYDLQVVVISSEGLSKCRATLDRIIQEKGPRTLVTLLCADAEDGELLSAPDTEHLVVPGVSVFELRALLPTILKEVGWVALMEDHAVPHQGWIGAAEAAVRAAGRDQVALTAQVTNVLSTSSWSWASFLFNFAYHWYPAAAAELPGTVTTLVFRRDLVGRRPLAVHAFEHTILGRRGVVPAEMVVDHNQPLSWWTASLHTYENGRVTGSALRRHHIAPRRAMMEMVKWVNVGRIREIGALLDRHPQRTKLPPGTLARLRWISACHGLGIVVGAIIGGGPSHRNLE